MIMGMMAGRRLMRTFQEPSRTFATTDAGWHTLARAGLHLLALTTFQERT